MSGQTYDRQAGKRGIALAIESERPVESEDILAPWEVGQVERSGICAFSYNPFKKEEPEKVPVALPQRTLVPPARPGEKGRDLMVLGLIRCNLLGYEFPQSVQSEGRPVVSEKALGIDLCGELASVDTPEGHEYGQGEISNTPITRTARGELLVRSWA